MKWLRNPFGSSGVQNSQASPQKNDGSARTVVFVLSATRSGSTWLSYVLGSHPVAACLGEYRRPFEFPGHTSCRLCEARGRNCCEFLSGIEGVETPYAHDFAFERLQKSILIDNSKRLHWITHFLDQKRFHVKVVHLLREPRGWLASEQRRTELSVETGIRSWLDENQKIVDLVATHGLACYTAFYDELAVLPDVHFPALCDFVGMPFERPSLEYWNFEHHGLGGNGAAMNVLGEYQHAKVLTGDDQFYKSHAKQSFYDNRWVVQSSPEQRTAIERSPEINEFLQRFGRSWASLDHLLTTYEAMNSSIGRAA